MASAAASDNNEESKIPRDALLPKQAVADWEMYFKKHPGETFPKVGDVYDLWTQVHRIGHYTVEAVDKGVVTGTAVVFESPLFEKHYKQAYLLAANLKGESLIVRDAARADLPVVKNVIFRPKEPRTEAPAEGRMTIEHIEKVMAGCFPNAPPRVLSPRSLTGSTFSSVFATDQDLHVFLKNFRRVKAWCLERYYIGPDKKEGWFLTLEVPGDETLKP